MCALYAIGRNTESTQNFALNGVLIEWMEGWTDKQGGYAQIHMGIGKYES